ncbi:MAG TPA: hypothetical protein VFI34_04945 [Candidatus Limnocylindrales bacterium]|nr:hypothetical protein [Candidatus Limnocylindrales bacterium]
MTTERNDRPLFANMDDDEPNPARDPDEPTPTGADAMGVNPAAAGAIPLGAPTEVDDDGSMGSHADEGDPRGH